MALPTFEEQQKIEQEEANKPLPVAYRSNKNGRVFRATATLRKHKRKLGLVELDVMPDELKTQKERNIEAALAKKAAEEAEAKQAAEVEKLAAAKVAEEKAAKTATTKTRRQKLQATEAADTGKPDATE